MVYQLRNNIFEDGIDRKLPLPKGKYGMIAIYYIVDRKPRIGEKFIDFINYAKQCSEIVKQEPFLLEIEG